MVQQQIKAAQVEGGVGGGGGSSVELNFIEKNVSPTGNAAVGGGGTEQVVPGMDLYVPAVGDEVVVSGQIYWSMNHSQSPKDVRVRLRRDGLGGELLAQTMIAATIDSNAGHDRNWVIDFVDSAPTTGRYVVTTQSEPGSSTSTIWSDTRTFQIETTVGSPSGGGGQVYNRVDLTTTIGEQNIALDQTPTGLEVYHNGILLAESQYTIDGLNIVLDVAPDTDDVITVKYFSDVAGSAVFSDFPTLSALIASMAPTHWWKLGETSGTVVADSGSGARDLDLSGTYTLGADGLDDSDLTRKSILFNGGGARSAAAIALGGAGVDDVTIVALYKPVAVSFTLKTIAGIEGGSWEGNSFQMRRDDAHLVANVGGTSGGQAGWTVNNQLGAGVRYMVALKRTPTTAQLYKDGAPVGSAQGVSSDLGANDRFGIGIRGSDGGRSENAYIQDVIVWKGVAITDAQLLALAQKAGVA